jgi:hypothetical protein
LIEETAEIGEEEENEQELEEEEEGEEEVDIMTDSKMLCNIHKTLQFVNLGVNFTNILRAAFSYKSFTRSLFVLLHFRFVLFLAQEYWR